MKLALIGGGGSRTPLLYHGLLQRSGSLPDLELVLHDTAPDWLARMATVLSGIDAERGGGVPVTTTTVLDDALDGADFVLTAIRVGGFAARSVDESVPPALGIVGQETVGPGGFALALRNVPAVVEVAEAMTRRCPAAWMVNLTNPAGIVTQAAATRLGDRVIGVCDSPTALMRRVADALGRDPDGLHFSYAGLNHLGWLTGVHAGGGDLLPGLLASRRLEQVEEVRLLGADRVRDLGAIPNEYLYYYERASEVVARTAGGSRGGFLARRRAALGAALDAASDPATALAVYRESLAERQDTYMATESGLEREPTYDVFADAGGYHEMALSVVEAIACDTPTVAVVNTRNRGALGFLPDDTVVEVPAVVRGAGAFPLASHVPPSQRALVEQVKGYEDRTLAAVGSGSPDDRVAALAHHPLVDGEEAARRIIDRYATAAPVGAGRH